MAYPSDHLIEQRQLNKRLFRWRIISVLLFAFILIVMATLAFGGMSYIQKNQSHIAKISISGFIANDDKMHKLIEEIGRKDAVKAVVVSIDSPGGTTVGGEALYEHLNRLSQQKPTIALIETMGTSAAYMAAIATDHIIARRTSITGSIGVVFQYAEVSALMDKIGINVNEIKSGTLKAEPTPFKPATEEARAEIKSLILNTYEWFVSIVSEKRNLNKTAIRSFKGGVFSGAQALEKGLIDAIGHEREAKKWFQDEHNIDPKISIIQYETTTPFEKFSPQMKAFDILAQQLNWPWLHFILSKMEQKKTSVDGLLSVWQVSTVNP